MKNILYIITLLLLSNIQPALAQVGIGTLTPIDSLDVNGNARLTGELTLENPGIYPTNIDNGQRYLIVDGSGNIKRYLTGSGANKAKYSPVNYATYKFNNIDTGENGLLDFDTKIPADKYIVWIDSYKFSDTNTIFVSNTGVDSVNGIVYRAYKSGGTWHLSFYGLDSELGGYDTGITQLDLTLKVVIYRNKLLMADDGSTITVNMGGNTTATAPKPTGY